MELITGDIAFKSEQDICLLNRERKSYCPCIHGTIDIAYRRRTRGPELDDGSSNLKECTNLANMFKEMGRQGDLKITEIFLFKDNSPSEAAYLNGTSQRVRSSSI